MNPEKKKKVNMRAEKEEEKGRERGCNANKHEVWYEVEWGWGGEEERRTFE